MGSVPMAIRRIVVAIESHRTRSRIGKIPAIGVIDVAICIVVDAIPCDFTRVGPDVVCKLRVCSIYTRVKHSNLKSVRSFAQCPRPGGINVHSCRRIESPLLGKARIIWNIGNMKSVIWFCRDDILGCA